MIHLPGPGLPRGRFGGGKEERGVRLGVLRV